MFPSLPWLSAALCGQTRINFQTQRQSYGPLGKTTAELYPDFLGLDRNTRHDNNRNLSRPVLTGWNLDLNHYKVCAVCALSTDIINKSETNSMWS